MRQSLCNHGPTLPQQLLLQCLCTPGMYLMPIIYDCVGKGRSNRVLGAGMQDLPGYLSPGPGANFFNSTDGQNREISCNQIKLRTRVGPPPAWFQQAALDPSSYNFAFCTCTGTFTLQVPCSLQHLSTKHDTEMSGQPANHTAGPAAAALSSCPVLLLAFSMQRNVLQCYNFAKVAVLQYDGRPTRHQASCMSTCC